MICLGRILPCSYVVRMELKHYHFPDEVFHMPGSLGQDIGVMKLDAVTQLHTVLSHGRFLWMIQPNVPSVLVDPDLNGTSCLSNVDFPKLTGDAINSWCFHPLQVWEGLHWTNRMFH